MKQRDYYAEITDAISRYERGLYPTHKIEWITDRIAWCAKFKRITTQQTAELCNRAIEIMPIAFAYD